MPNTSKACLWVKFHVVAPPSVRSGETKSPNVVGYRLPRDAIDARTQPPGHGHVNGLGKWYIKVHAMGLGNKKKVTRSSKNWHAFVPGG
jgi:hypothetical protein